MHHLRAAALALAATTVLATPIQKPSSSLSKRDDSDNLPFINSIDSAYAIPLKAWNQQLVDNAYKTAMDNQGVSENHELNPGSMAQVIAPGRYDANPSTGPYTPFQVSYYMWLCEVPGDAQLAGICDGLSQYSGNIIMSGTGHHDILTNPGYTQIGCAFFTNAGQTDPTSPWQGIWVCDLA